MIKFYDTNALLLLGDRLFNERFAISSITLSELEGIKSSSSKSEEMKFKARRLLNALDTHTDKFDIHIFQSHMLDPIKEKDLEINNDMKILATAFDYDRLRNPDNTMFITNDMALKLLANLFFGEDSIGSVAEEIDNYTGYVEKVLNETELTDFYQNPAQNHYNLYTNQYLIIKNADDEVVDILKWNGEEHVHIKYYTFESQHFGAIKPMKNDVYQQLAFDAIANNQITMLKGPAGSGKTLLSLGYLMSQLEKRRIDKIVIFCNTVATLHSAKLGLAI